MARSMVVMSQKPTAGRREGADRVRAGHTGVERPGSVRGARHRARGAPVRLAVAVRAGHRRLPRSDRRPRRGRRAHHQDQVRVLGARRARPQPDAAGQGAGHPRPAQPRPAAARPSGSAPSTPASTRPSAWSGATGPRSSTRCSRCSAGSGPARPSTTTGAFHRYEGAVGAAAPAPGPARDLARRHRAVRAAALRPAGRRLAAVVLHPRGRAGRASSSSRATPPKPTARSTPSTSAP